MARQRNELHAKQVEAWKKKIGNLSPGETTLLLIKAILAIRKRSLVTLSGVTVTAVIDRQLFEAKEKFPVLMEVTNDSAGLYFGKFCETSLSSESDEAQNSLQEFLIDLLDVFGKITADILTKYLHRELMTVTNETSSGEQK